MTTTTLTATLYFGSDIARSASDVLNGANENALVQKVKQEDNSIAELLRNYKRMLTVDARAAAELKKKLPYFIGATFKNGIRCAANFERIDYFVLDLDNLKKNRQELNSIKNFLATDSQLLMCFISPSGNGLKCVFKLTQPFFSTVQYTQFYKSFALQFAAHNGLADFVDYTTCDVTRVCFLANDRDVYYNEKADTVDTNSFNTDNHYIAQEKTTISATPPDEKQPLTEDVYKQILKKLNPDGIIKKPKQLYVPAELKIIHPLVAEALTKYDFTIKEVKPINYGEKYIVTHKLQMAEINIYYGKQGFQVIKSPKNGTNPNFNDAVCLIVTQAIQQGWTQQVTP